MKYLKDLFCGRVIIWILLELLKIYPGKKSQKTIYMSKEKALTPRDQGLTYEKNINLH